MIRGLYGIADASFGDPVELGRRLLLGGASALQVRAKDWEPERVGRALERLHPLCQDAGVPLLVNDHAELAGLCDGVHLGQGDGPLPRSGLRGRSTHSLEQLQAALDEGADYVGFGPVFPTRTKLDADPARGLDLLARVVQRSTVPVVAIGGIDARRLPSVRATGVQAWAVIRAILADPDPCAAARLYAASGDRSSPPGSA